MRASRVLRMSAGSQSGVTTVAPKESDIWFPSKLYGFGWGFPIRWQGWVVLFAYLALLVACIRWLLPEHGPLFFTAAAVLTLGFVAVCCARGERPRWRWGGR
jgi:hypothetical protein